jgi:hypothetical protein
MRAVLRFTNPVKLLKGLADIFLTKMLGKNLVQRMIAEAYIKVQRHSVTNQPTNQPTNQRMMSMMSCASL